jgi:hypothetical protein
VAWPTGSRPRRAAILGEGAPDGAAVAADALGLGSGASRHGPCQGAPTPAVFCEALVGMAVSCRDRCGGRAPVRQVTQVVRDLGSGLGDSRAAGRWPSRNAPRQGPVQSLLHRTDPGGSVVVGSRQAAAGQEHLAREPSAQAPAEFLPNVRLEPIAGEADTALRRCQAPPPCRVGPRKRHQFVVTLSPLGHRPGRAREPTRAHRLRDGRDTGMVGLARWAHAREDLAATCVRGQRQAPVRCGPGRFPHGRTRWLEAAPHLEGQPSHGRQGREGAIVVRSGPQGRTAAGTLAHNGRQRLRQGWGRAGCRTSQ